jgi:hypothetical protein
MKKHIKIYLNYFGFGEQSFIPSEISGKRASDIHHILRRGMGGSKDKDNIENLMALTREEHEKYGDKKEYIEYLKLIHLNYLKNANICN